MRKFAYLDKAGIMHVVKERETAEEFCKMGTIVETDIKAANGFPTDDENEGVIVYASECMKHEADKSFIEPIKELTELYKKCMAK